MVFVGISRLLNKLVTTSMIFSWSLGNLGKVKVNEELNGVRLEHKYFYNFFPKDNLKQVVVVKWISLLRHHISNIQYVSILQVPDYPDWLTMFAVSDLRSHLNISCWTSLPQCWMILCISSWTSSTQRRLGSSSRLICLLTSNSKLTCLYCPLKVMFHY